MVYRIPTPGNVIPSERARTPRFFDAAVQQQAQANALREGKEREKQQKLAAAVSLLSSAGGEGGWLQALGMGKEMADKEDASQEDMTSPEGGQEMTKADTAAAAMSAASLASGNPMGLIGLKKLYDTYS